MLPELEVLGSEIGVPYAECDLQNGLSYVYAFCNQNWTRALILEISKDLTPCFSKCIEQIGCAIQCDFTLTFY